MYNSFYTIKDRKDTEKIAHSLVLDSKLHFSASLLWKFLLLYHYRFNISMVSGSGAEGTRREYTCC